MLSKILILLFQIVFVIGFAYFIVNYTLEKTSMHDSSMEPAIAEDNLILVNKFIYWFSKPKRYDVIVFKQSGEEHSYYNIKRIIGLPGEKIIISEGIVYINGEVLEDDIYSEQILSAGLAQEEILLEDNEYFVLGDNRNDSEDSRFANIGTVVKSDIIGKAWIITKPSLSFIGKPKKLEEK